MAAGERVHCLGVLRIVVGELFGRHAVLEMHRGIEDVHGEIFYSQLEEVGISWDSLKETLGATDLKALCRIIEKLSDFASSKTPALKKSRHIMFDVNRKDMRKQIPNLL